MAVDVVYIIDSQFEHAFIWKFEEAGKIVALMADNMYIFQNNKIVEFELVE